MAEKMSAEALEGLGQRVATTMCCTFSVMTGETQREARITSEDWYAMLAHIAALQSEADRLREALEQISLFAGPTLPRYENALNIIRDMQYVARAALSATQQDASPVQPAQKTE